MSNSRNPLVDPQPGDVIEIIAGWKRTVTAVEDNLVQYHAVYEWGKFDGCVRHIDAWRRDCKKARVIRRGEDV